jgi:ABC-2 type transport system permease protein
MTVETITVPRGPVQRLRWTIGDGWTLTRRALLHWMRQPAQIIIGAIGR